MHSNLRWRARHPLRASFLKVKASARQKKAGFELTFEQYAAAVQNCGLPESLLQKRVYSIDRIVHDGPYALGNIQFVSHRDNAARRRNCLEKLALAGETFRFQDPVYRPFGGADHAGTTDREPRFTAKPHP